MHLKNSLQFLTAPVRNLSERVQESTGNKPIGRQIEGPRT